MLENNLDLFLHAEEGEKIKMVLVSPEHSRAVLLTRQEKRCITVIRELYGLCVQNYCLKRVNRTEEAHVQWFRDFYIAIHILCKQNIGA